MVGRVAKAASLASAAFLLVLIGVLLAEFRLPPQPIVARAINALEDGHENGLAYLGVKPVQHLRPLRFGDGARVATTEPTAPGVILLVGLFGETLGARLLDRGGALVFEWPVDLFRTIDDRMAFRFDGLVHGTWLYPNGDLIANMDSVGLVRLDACGEIIWRNVERTHHSVFVDDQGFIWSPKYTDVYRVPAISAQPFRFDQVGKFDSDTGALVDVIDLVDVLIEAGLEGVVLGNWVDTGDVMHLNDVEILSAAMADAFPGFEAGDIMLSGRNLNQVWVLDGRTHALKWWQTGPMHRQHDPDFQPDGRITILDNRTGGPSGADGHPLGRMGGSRILSLDPKQRAATTLFAAGGEDGFYTEYRGKHQVLPNGNLLITETDAGRVLEIGPGGDVVWSYINRWDDDEVAWIMEATWYPESYRRIADISCAGGAE